MAGAATAQSLSIPALYSDAWKPGYQVKHGRICAKMFICVSFLFWELLKMMPMAILAKLWSFRLFF